jgi:DNA topoisomerase IB
MHGTLEPGLADETDGAAADPRLSARAAGLRHASDRAPGIRRIRAGKGFRDRAADGHFVREAVLRDLRASLGNR